MKPEQEQIEEMRKTICIYPVYKGNCEICCWKPNCNAIRYIDRLYSVGYRKASDVIEEFVERIKDRALQSCRKIINCYEVTKIETIIDDIAAEMRKEVEK